MRNDEIISLPVKTGKEHLSDIKHAASQDKTKIDFVVFFNRLL